MSQYYRYLKFQKYINGVPQDEYKEGDLIGTYEFDNITDCEQGVEYRWVDSGTLCDGYDKYLRLVKLKYDPDVGVWQDTSEFKKGTLIEQWSLDCGVVWQYRWNPTGLTKCDGYALSNEEVYLVSKDMGNTWLNVEPALYRYIPVDGEEFNYDCVILTEPLEITIESDSDIGIWINNDTSFEHGNISGTPMMYGKGFRYIVDWGEGSPPILHVPTESLTNREISSMYKIPKHDYVVSGTYKIKVWGSIGAITDFNKPYTINNWGKGLGTTRETSFKITSWTVADLVYNNAYVFSYLKEGKYLSYIEIGENCQGFPEWSEGLTDNNTFKCNNTKFTDLKLDFTKIWTNYLFINCPNLTVTPKLCPKVNGIPNAYKMVSFEGCSKLTETPQGGMFSNLYNDRILIIPDSFLGAAIAENRIGGDYKNAFKGCTSLTKINGPIITFTSDFMFEGCTGLTDLNNLEMKIDSTIGMFKDCTNLTGTYTLRPFEKAEGETQKTDSFYCYFRNSMFENTKVSYVDPDMISSIKISGERYTISTERMFYNTPVTKVSFSLNDRDDVLYNMKEMFSQSTANNIDGLFLDLKSYPIMNKMFENCNITNLEGVFNYNTTYIISGTSSNYPINWKYLYPMESYFLSEYSEEYLFNSSNLNEMFASNTNLINYPTYNNYPMWYWTNLYKDTILLKTYAFANCPLIAQEVPPEWGGLSDRYPMVLSFTGEGTYSVSNEPINIDYGEGISTETSHNYTTNEKHTILVYDGLTINPNKLTDIEDFGTINFNFNNPAININSVGPTHGLFKDQYKIEINFNKQLTKLDPEFFSNCENITKLNILGLNMTELGFQLKDYMPNLTNVEDCFSNSTITNFDGLFENSKIDTCYGFAEDAPEGISINRLFKNCNLNESSNIENLLKKAIYLNEVVMNCSEVRNNGRYIYNTWISAVRAFYNTGVTSMSFNNSQNKVQHDLDLTECYKNCASLSKINSYLNFNLDGTLNLTRCFENCTALIETPTFTYSDSTGDFKVKLWEVEGKVDYYSNEIVLAKKIIGTECFKGCTQLTDYDEIPDDWK